MTDSRIAPDNYDAMTIEQLRETIRAKQGALNDVLRRNQELEAEVRRNEGHLRKRDSTVEAQSRKIKMLQDDLTAVVIERESAKRLAALLHEKIVLIATSGHKTSDLKKLAHMYFQSMSEVSAITAWPELLEWDFFNKIFTAAEDRVFGKKGPKKPTDAKDFIARSLAKKDGNA